MSVRILAPRKKYTAFSCPEKPYAETVGRPHTFSFRRASLKGLLGRAAAAVMGALVLESAIVKKVWNVLNGPESS